MISKLQVVLQVLLIVSVIEGLATETCSEWSAVRNIPLNFENQNQAIQGGVVQICNLYQSMTSGDRHYTWDFITTEGWTKRAAQVVCSRLGYPDSNVKWFSVTLPASVNRVTGLEDCSESAYHLLQCFPYESKSRDESQDVAALSCYCHEGAMRLVGGSTNREGRVEVCVDGRWGTVCSQPEWTAMQAGYVCSQLGFSEYNASFSDQFGRGSGPVYTYAPCTIQSQGFNSSCGVIDSSSDIAQCVDHTVGVRCQAHDTCRIATNHDTTDLKRSDTTSATTPTCIPSKQLENTTDQERGSKTDCLVVTLPANEDKNIGSPINTLGALTGLLTAALVIVTVGWIVSCVYWQRRDKQRQLIIETYSRLPQFVRSEVVTTANIVSNDVINQPALATPSEIDNLKSNEAYTMVMTCSTNPSYTVMKPAREEN